MKNTLNVHFVAMSHLFLNHGTWFLVRPVLNYRVAVKNEYQKIYKQY